MFLNVKYSLNLAKYPSAKPLPFPTISPPPFGLVCTLYMSDLPIVAVTLQHGLKRAGATDPQPKPVASFYFVCMSCILTF